MVLPLLFLQLVLLVLLVPLIRNTHLLTIADKGAIKTTRFTTSIQASQRIVLQSLWTLEMFRLTSRIRKRSAAEGKQPRGDPGRRPPAQRRLPLSSVWLRFSF